MSERILKALMQLFAIIANRDLLTDEPRGIVINFLRQQVASRSQEFYLKFFDDYFVTLRGKSSEGREGKRIAANSVKVLKICTEINGELDQKQKYIVLLKLIEFSNSFGEPAGQQEVEFIETVSSVFNISPELHKICNAFCQSMHFSELPDSDALLVIHSGSSLPYSNIKGITNETLYGELCFLNVKDEGLLFVRYFGNMPLLMNGQTLKSGQVYPFSQGSVIREARLAPVYYSDVVRCFLDFRKEDQVSLTVNQVEYRFGNGAIGMHPISFSATSGNLIGIMGGSGAGKSTLLNILNGNLTPQTGEVLVNGVNIHRQKDQLQGVIGYIPQDDLLMDDLTVFQNLFYNSKLGLGDLPDEEITRQAEELLDSLGLLRIKDLRVGDPLNKMVSGGQRKRLNIALELIRKPEVLFVDEPTSGLSSLDSENVMDLLKQLSLQGKLIFVVIHQPSSDIFKLFDKLLILDIGGYPIYYGNPSDSVIYFKKTAGFASADTSECVTCGNINPEQIFTIIESKVFDEFGHPTPNRKISSQEWYSYYEENRLPNVANKNQLPAASKRHSKPSRMRQLKVFLTRDVLSKLRNNQYMMINFLEAPVLAFILAYFLKYYAPGAEYFFKDNLNLPAYIFMGVIVALFMGLTVSAEEIIKDRKILKREEFLDLSRGSYLFSKIMIMLGISAIQTFTFVVIGNYIFEVQGMFTDYWLMLFSVSCFGNLMGLNISSAFNSAVTIYILIPFLIIPQIILSGVMVKFDNLNPVVSNRTKVPIIGEIMASRWAFEALAVNQYSKNEYEKHFFDLNKKMSETVFRRDFWIVKMNDKLDSLHNGFNKKDNELLLMNEFSDALGRIPVESKFSTTMISNAGDKVAYSTMKQYLNDAKKFYMNHYKALSKQRDQRVKVLEAKVGGAEYLSKLKADYTNDGLSDLVSTTGDFDFIIEENHRFVRRFRPVMMDGSPHTLIRAPFYVSGKNLFGTTAGTYAVNLMVIWLMTGVLVVTLYNNSLRKLLSLAENLFSRKFSRKKKS
jgi:ABC-type multidrug transport system ATPase subunit